MSGCFFCSSHRAKRWWIWGGCWEREPYSQSQGTWLSSNIPLDRAQNRFEYAGRVRHTSGNHLWTAGTEFVRRQVNGLEAESHRGIFFFNNDFL